MNETMQSLMREATRLTQSGSLKEATALIQRALGNAGAGAGAGSGPVSAPAPASSLTPASTERALPESSPVVLDGCVFEVPQTAPPQGEFADGSHTHASLTRRYKLYTPPKSFGNSLPLVVMLHGCTQNPDDFAAGTGMNAHARDRGFYVLYPAQSADANPQRCWNWFKHTHQSRGRGEAALLAGMTLSIMQHKGIDPHRVYIAGLSAGGAMAAIVAAAYPEIYAAVGVHSGLAVGAASNVPEALAAMRSGAKDGKAGSVAGAVPTIVFHGDQDQTVHPRNGEQVIAAASATSAASENHVEQGTASGGRRFTRTVHQGNIASHSSSTAEHWLVHGGGHAWSGGDSKGTYTDPKGPDASREMLRFFLTHQLTPPPRK